MAYGFNEDKSKAPMYTAEEIDVQQSQQNSALNVQKARIDTMAANGTGGIETRELLYSNNSGAIGTTITLSKDASNFDCLEYAIGSASATQLVRTPNSGGEISGVNSSVSGHLRHAGIMASVSGTSMTLSSATELDYENADTSWTYDGQATNYPKVYAVYGIKYAKDCSDEVEDLRIGINGETYSTAGEAIRARDVNHELTQFKILRHHAVSITRESGVAHHSTDDQIAFHTIQDEYYDVKITVLSGSVSYVQVFEYEGSEDGVQAVQISAADFGIWKHVKALTNSDFIGFWIPSDSGAAELVIEVRHQDSQSVKQYNDDRITDRLFCKNLTGAQNAKLYMTPTLHAGDRVVISKKDGTPVTGNLFVDYFDIDKKYLNYSTLRTTDPNGTRNVVVPSTAEGARYIMVDTKNGDNSAYQVELANTKTTIVDHWDSPLQAAEESRSILDDLMTFASTDFYIPANQGHSSLIAPVPFEIKSGETFLLRTEATTAVSYVSIFAFDENLVEVQRWSAQPVNGDYAEYSALADIKFIGIYVPNQTIATQIHARMIKLDPIFWDKSKEFDDDEYCETYAGSFIADDVSDAEAFLFFTDPHTIQHTFDRPRFDKSIRRIKSIFDRTSASFVLCGGDWLQNSDTKLEAATKLGYMDGVVRSAFPGKFYPMVGNHDTNYQGKSHQDEAYNFADKLSNDQLIKLGFHEFNSLYYDFVAPGKTHFYVFDTQLDWYPNMNDYFWEQAKWFASSLLQNDDDHSVIALHIIKRYAADEGVQPFADQLTLIAKAYNNRTSITIAGSTYNFNSCQGIVSFMIGGHVHEDQNGIANTIPWIVTVNSGYNSNLDLCFADYENHLLKMTRVGTGNDRQITIL